jgi:predicted CopG family antitoxin
VKHLNIPLDDDTHERLAEVKGDRSWSQALREEFGIDE